MTENTLRVAYLGPPSSFSQSAAEKYFYGTTSSLCPCQTIPGVFETILANEANYGVVPMENTIGGRIHQTLEGFGNPNIRVVGQVYLRVVHNLISNSPMESVRKIYSHPQALAQCSNFLLANFQGAEAIPTSSTARAAELASEEQGTAAISSEEAASRFGLKIIFDNIQDEEDNVTRFLIISKSEREETFKSADYTTFIILQTLNTAGSLAKVMNVFSLYNISLSRLDSFPSKGEENLFNFLLELKGDPDSILFKEAVTKLVAVTTKFRVLGSCSTR